MFQHKGLLVRLSGRSPSSTCFLPRRTSSAHMDEESFPRTERFQQLCTASQAAKSCRCNMWLECWQSQ